MNKNILWLLGILLSLSIGFASCSEDTPEADPYSDWAVRNDAYIDSIASVCANPPAGESWLRVLDYKIQTEASEGLGNQTYTPGKNDYVYMKLFPEDNIEPLGISPLGTDTVAVHYRGKLINGTVFDESFSGDWNAAVSEPRKFAVSAVITGWTTALMQMKEGQHVEMYIPNGLGYGAASSDAIPSYSTLIFDVRLEEVIHPKGPDDRSLKLKVE
ncbi:peptidyl-prolyl cis-trans isomerase [Bacteroides sp. CAG:1076]|jgi:FKBP-type peptidyl-prolyl cis-trans isomerase FklB|uniref:FKBP-type peptidyl-prolyl cis-trans isomerase n=1 Tax=Phocaeicola sp. TaxID=2773926 RepID=UPI0003399170|nr:peptidyl-prolyl cis-trans isomerase [Bacteroides sp. CAG:1076]